MASGFFAVLDDIAALMDDVALATKLATRKTAGILGDDLAVNAEKATGFLAEKELPILWKITKGSFINKLIIVPAALLLNYYLPVVVTIILLAGGCFLAYEGAVKIVEYVTKSSQTPVSEHSGPAPGSDESEEKQKIRSAITTDFILSVEIVIIALGTVLDKNLTIQILTVSAVALLATVGVYGIVALIIRMDDLGYRLIRQSANKGFVAKIGQGLVAALPVVIRILSIVGTLALLLVAGGIFVHNTNLFHGLSDQIPAVLIEFGMGLLVGVLIVVIVKVFKALFSRKKSSCDI